MKPDHEVGQKNAGAWDQEDGSEEPDLWTDPFRVFFKSCSSVSILIVLVLAAVIFLFRWAWAVWPL